MQKKNIAVCIILSIVTCGIYAIYWYYTIAKGFYDEHTENSGNFEPGIVIVLDIITCGIYGMYLYYKWGKATPEIYAKYGLQTEDKSILYLVLGYFLSIVAMCLIQDDFNKLIDATGGVYAQNGVNYPPYNNMPYYPPAENPSTMNTPAPGSPYDVNENNETKGNEE